MSAIYEPKGRAREYAALAVNLYTGCTHGCLYCYAPSALRRTRESFHANVAPRKGILEALAKDADKLAARLAVDQTECPEILLCFTGDPYPAKVDTSTTREALQILGEAGLKASVLTKGGTRAMRDFDLLAQYGFSFGTSLVCATVDRLKESRPYWEPGAAPFAHREYAIREAHSMRIRTWVSLEPVIFPEQSLEMIRKHRPYVDHWKVGKINHHKELEAAVDWPKFLVDVLGLFRELEITDYYIKDDLRRAAAGPGK
jgi:DNA repair photolyase